MIQEQVYRGVTDDGRELLKEFDGLEEQVRRSIVPQGLKLDEDASIGAKGEAVLGERGTEEVAAKLPEAGAIVGGDPDVGGEVEAVEVGLTRAAGDGVTGVQLVADAPDGSTGAGPGATQPWTEALTRLASTPHSPGKYAHADELQSCRGGGDVIIGLDLA